MVIVLTGALLLVITIDIQANDHLVALLLWAMYLLYVSVSHSPHTLPI